MKNGVQKNYVKFTVQRLYRSLFFNKVTSLMQVSGVSCEVCDIFKNTSFTELLWPTAFDYCTKGILRKYDEKDAISDHSPRKYGVKRL